MPYTLWLHDRLVGETDFEHPGPAPAQHLGVFRPTTHGLEVLPELCGFLGATFALKCEMERRGLVNEHDQADGMLETLEQSDEGNRLVEIVKRLAELQLRSPDGTLLTITSIALTDLRELAALAQQAGSGHDISSEARTHDGRPRYLISATLVADEAATRTPRRTLPRFPTWLH